MQLTIGQMMFYGGITGAVICVLAVIILLIVFSVRRKKILKKIMETK